MEYVKKLVEERKAQRLPQKFVAAELGISLVSYNRWERGHVSLNIERLERWAKALGKNLQDIIGEKN